MTILAIKHATCDTHILYTCTCIMCTVYAYALSVCIRGGYYYKGKREGRS